jgi:hypothetical protein
LELVFADVLPNLFGQFGSGEWVFPDHCGQCGVGLHGLLRALLGVALLPSTLPRNLAAFFTFDPLVLPDLFFDKVGDSVERIGIH